MVEQRYESGVFFFFKERLHSDTTMAVPVTLHLVVRSNSQMYDLLSGYLLWLVEILYYWR